MGREEREITTGCVRDCGLHWCLPMRISNSKIFGLNPKVMLPQPIFACIFVVITFVGPTKVSIMKLKCTVVNRMWQHYFMMKQIFFGWYFETQADWLSRLPTQVKISDTHGTVCFNDLGKPNLPMVRWFNFKLWPISSILHRLPQKMKLALKEAKIDTKIIISIPWSKSVKLLCRFWEITLTSVTRKLIMKYFYFLTTNFYYIIYRLC